MAQQLLMVMDMREQLLRSIVYQHKRLAHLKELEHKPYHDKITNLIDRMERNLAINQEKYKELLGIYGPLEKEVVRTITHDIRVLEALPPVEIGDIGALEARLLREAFEKSIGIHRRNAGKKSRRRTKKSRRCKK